MRDITPQNTQTLYWVSLSRFSVLSYFHTTDRSSREAIIADEVQEVIEIALVPLCATLLVPMNFHELNLLACYT